MLAIVGLVSGFYPVTFFGLILVITSLISRQKVKQREEKSQEFTRQQEYETSRKENVQEEMSARRSVSEVPYIMPALFPDPILPPISPIERQERKEEEKAKDDEIIELLLLLSALRLLS